MTTTASRIIATLAVSAMLAAAPGAAHAQNAAAQQACKGDYQRLCSNVSPGGGRIMACLQGHPEKLSAPCKDALAHAGK